MGNPPPTDIRSLITAAVRLHQTGRLDQAEELYRQVLAADPRQPDALHFLGVLAHQRGRHDAAIDFIRGAIAENDRVPAFHNNLGNALKAQGRLEDAALAYRRAIALRPDHVEAHCCLGLVLHLQGRHSEAAASYRRALALKPDQVEAQRNLALALLQLGALDGAFCAARDAVLRRPDDAESQLVLGHVLKELGRSGEAHECYARALASKPDLGEAALGAALSAIPIFAEDAAASRAVPGAFDRALDDLGAWCRAHPAALGRAVGMSQPFYLAYRPTDLTQLLRRYGDLVAAEARKYRAGETKAPTLPAGRAMPVSGEGLERFDERIRLLVVSGQVRRHPAWDVVLRGIIAHLDRRRFELLIYHTGALVDEETEWARSCADRFLQGPKSTDAWLREVGRDRPRVIFYPEVGMDPAVGALAALRLAPLQAAGWGHPVTSGLPTIDLFLSGELIEAPGAERHYRERLIRLPGTGVCTEPRDEPAPADGNEAGQGKAGESDWQDRERAPGVVRFTVCQQPIKLDPADDDLLARIVASAGPCELWLVTPNKLEWAGMKLRARLQQALLARGLDPEAHLRVTPWLAPREFASFLDAMDIYLDCPAFSGYTTAWQAVHRGLPILTLEGEFMRQRLAAGLLRQIGVTEGIAAGRDQYVDRAVRFAAECRDSEAWNARRAAIRAAAPRADGNRAAVDAFGHALIEALSRTGSGWEKSGL